MMPMLVHSTTHPSPCSSWSSSPALSCVQCCGLANRPEVDPAVLTPLLERRVDAHARPQHHGANLNPLAVISRVEANGWKRNHFGATAV